MFTDFRISYNDLSMEGNKDLHIKHKTKYFGVFARHFFAPDILIKDKHTLCRFHWYASSVQQKVSKEIQEKNIL